MTYDKGKDYYDRGLWNITRVKNAVIKEVITGDQYREITGEEYTE
jgi:hypothetical protein